MTCVRASTPSRPPGTRSADSPPPPSHRARRMATVQPTERAVWRLSSPPSAPYGDWSSQPSHRGHDLAGDGRVEAPLVDQLLHVLIQVGDLLLDRRPLTGVDLPLQARGGTAAPPASPPRR